MKNNVRVFLEGEESVHMRGMASDYSTACGIDPYDPSIGHNGMEMTSDKIDCETCWSIYIGSRCYTRKDFSKKVQS